jgi:hypothetical protein
MNAAYFHIASVHLPVILTPLGALLLVVAHMRHSATVARVALGILVAAALFAIPVFLLGEPAEEIVEHLPGISEELIEAHEEAAEVGLWVSIASGLISLITWRLIAIGAFLERAFLTLTFLTATVASVALGYTAHQGGKIRHPEAFQAPSAEKEMHTDHEH